MTDASGAPDLEKADAPEVEPETEHGCPVTWSRGQRVLHAPRHRWTEVLAALRDDGYFVCVDVTAVDYLTFDRPRDLPADVEAERFEVVANLVDHRDRRRVRVRTQVPQDDPVLASLFDLFPGTEAAEREVFDMFGIRFDGHPDLTRILMPEDWEGHPLRKDGPSSRIPVQFKAAPPAR